jgi:hypothetical protein
MRCIALHDVLAYAVKFTEADTPEYSGVEGSFQGLEVW